MKKFKLSFRGRQVGAIGIMQGFSVEIEAEDERAAVLKLYDTHEHIMGLRIRVVPEGTLYAALLAAGVPLDHHESDLYAKVTPESRAIVDAFGDGLSVERIFRSKIDNELWYDLPFRYLPWWEARQPKNVKE